jgi:hypothetical protein
VKFAAALSRGSDFAAGVTPAGASSCVRLQLSLAGGARKPSQNPACAAGERRAERGKDAGGRPMPGALPASEDDAPRSVRRRQMSARDFETASKADSAADSRDPGVLPAPGGGADYACLSIHPALSAVPGGRELGSRGARPLPWQTAPQSRQCERPRRLWGRPIPELGPLASASPLRLTANHQTCARHPSLLDGASGAALLAAPTRSAGGTELLGKDLGPPAAASLPRPRLTRSGRTGLTRVVAPLLSRSAS